MFYRETVIVINETFAILIKFWICGIKLEGGNMMRNKLAASEDLYLMNYIFQGGKYYELCVFSIILTHNSPVPV